MSGTAKIQSAIAKRLHPNISRSSPMFLLREPTDEIIRAYIGEQAQLGFTYSALGASGSKPPRLYQFDHNRFLLGNGEALFNKAKDALQRWQQFDLGWSHAHSADTPIAPGQVVAIVFHTLGLWCVCSARIVYVINEPLRFGFAYGTLPGHVECGEERFLVEQDGNGDVWYSLRAFSRPRHPLTIFGYPYVRWLQKQFVRESGEAMRRSVTV